MRDFNAQLVEKDKKAVLKGNINPGWDNKTVAWEKRTCKSCKWKTIDTAKSGDNGSWSFEAATRRSARSGTTAPSWARPPTS